VDRYGNRNAAIWIANTARQLNSSLLSVKKISSFLRLLTARVSAVSLKNAPCNLTAGRRHPQIVQISKSGGVMSTE